MRDRKAAQPQRVQQPEHGGVCAHPERKRDDRGCGERPVAPQQTQAEPDVVPQRLETRAAADVPYLCLDRVDSPELQRRRAPRLGRRRTLLQVFIDQQLECRAQLVVEVALDAIAMRDVAPQTSKPGPERHREPPLPLLYRMPIRARVCRGSYRMSIGNDGVSKGSRSVASAFRRKAAWVINKFTTATAFRLKPEATNLIGVASQAEGCGCRANSNAITSRLKRLAQKTADPRQNPTTTVTDP